MWRRWWRRRSRSARRRSSQRLGGVDPTYARGRCRPFAAEEQVSFEFVVRPTPQCQVFKRGRPAIGEWMQVDRRTVARVRSNREPRRNRRDDRHGHPHSAGGDVVLAQQFRPRPASDKMPKTKFEGENQETPDRAHGGSGARHASGPSASGRATTSGSGPSASGIVTTSGSSRVSALPTANHPLNSRERDRKNRHAQQGSTDHMRGAGAEVRRQEARAVIAAPLLARGPHRQLSD